MQDRLVANEKHFDKLPKVYNNCKILALTFRVRYTGNNKTAIEQIWNS